METVTMLPAIQRDRGVEWCAVSRPVPGESVSGDRHLVVPCADGVLLAVIDGLGHGDEATTAARTAADVLTSHVGEPVVQLIQLCDAALRATRGAAMTLLFVNRRERLATAIGIGNVETVLVRADQNTKPARESVLLRNGVVGFRLPPLQTSALPIAPGDLVVFATDGVREDFGDRLEPGEPLPQLVERIATQKFRGTDDALVLACRILSDHES